MALQTKLLTSTKTLENIKYSLEQNKIKIWIIIEWIATITLILGVALTSWNIYPANIYMSALGNFLWLLIGFYWRKFSLIVIQFVIMFIYIGGIIKLFMHI